MKKCEKLLSSKCFHLVKNCFLGIKYFSANVQCLYIVYAKYQISAAKALVQDKFHVYAISEF